MNTLNIFADLSLDVILAALTLIRKVRAVRNLIAEVVNPAGRACLSDSVFVVMERSCWKGWFVPPPYLDEHVSTPPYREECLVTPPCREERLVTPPCREERLIRTRRSVSLHTIACRLHACIASWYTLVTRLLHDRTECCCTLVSRLVALL
jgi:hypothetical protein